MQDDIAGMIEGIWRETFAALRRGLGHALRSVEDLVRLEEHRRDGHTGEQLMKSMGLFGSSLLDASSLSELLGSSASGGEAKAQRDERLASLRLELADLCARCEAEPVPCVFASAAEPLAGLLERSDKLLGRMAEVFRPVRAGRLQSGARYDARRHNELLGRFSWKDFTPAELKLCAPFVARLGPEDDLEAHLPTILALLASGRPLQVLLLRPAPRPPGSAHALDPAMMALALRSVFVCQAAATAPDLRDRVAAGLASPHPALFSILCADEKTASGAVASRAFPSLLYDPERSPEFVDCFDLSGNPDSESTWTKKPAGSGEKTTDYTAADFAFAAGAADGEFTPVPDGGKIYPVPLVEYLALAAPRRENKTPFIEAAGPDGIARRYAPSAPVIKWATDRLHLWKTLQAVSGIANPHVRRALQSGMEKSAAESAEAIKALRESMEEQARARERAAMTSAVQTLVARLTGVTVTDVRSKQ